MAEEISGLLEIFREDNDPKDLSNRFRSDSIKRGLEYFYSILDRGINEIDGGKLGLESWSQPQTQAVLAIARSIVYSSRSISVERMEPIVVGILEQLLEFCVCCLERLVLDSGDDLDLQSNVLELLEIALVDEMDKNFDTLQPCPVGGILVESLPTIQVKSGINLSKHINCNVKGINCLKEVKPVDRVLMTLTSDCLQQDAQAMHSSKPIFRQDSNSMMSLAQHWAVVHMRCMPRLLKFCRELVVGQKLCGDLLPDAAFCSRMSLSLKILKLLGNVVKSMPYMAYDEGLLWAIASFADELPNLFKLRFEFISDPSTSDIGIEGLTLSLLEEFLQFVQVVFCDGSIFQNVQTCMLASIFDILDVEAWSYDKSSPSFSLPLVYSPRIVIHLLKLVGNVKNRSSLIFNWKETLDMDCFDHVTETEIGAFSCHARSTKVSLLKKYTVEDHLKLVFPQSNQWLHSFMQLVHFLHSEGVKLRPKVDRLRLSAKNAALSDVESVISHEDEALFGNLFSETGRPAALTDGHDQSSLAVSSCCNMPTQAAIELLNFLKLSIFSHEWHSAVYEDACTKLEANHIDLLLSILLCQACLSDEKASESGSARKPGNINEVCFELLQNLLLQRALGNSLEEHLVDQILKVENGMFIYNDHTLTLLAHALVCKVGLAGSCIRTKIYERYCHFILEKATHIASKCFTLKEFLVSLPSAFHIEILLMAFHLSNDAEKATLASLLFSTLRAIVAPASFNCMQLSCWSLLVSRLILVLRHMLFYASACPSWLLSRVRSKLRESPLRSPVSDPKINHLLSWVSVAVENIMGEWIKEQPVLSSLLHQVMDFSMVSAPLSGSGQTLQCLGLNWDDLCVTFSWILGFWKGKKPEAVEDLVIERYMFIICWDTCGTSSASNCLLPLGCKLQALDLLNVESFFRFSHSLVSNSGSICNDMDIAEVTDGVLHQLHSVHLIQHVEEKGWDFLRKGAWLFLVLSMLQAGTWMFSLKCSIPGVERMWMEPISKDKEFLALAESLVASIFEGSQVQWLFEVLSSLLKGYLYAIQDAFVSVLDFQHCADGFSPLLLLKHTVFEKHVQHELLEKSRYHHRLESICSLLPKLEELVNKEASGVAAQAIRRSLLHGFPSLPGTSSGELVSCILTVEGIVHVLDGLLKVKNARSDFHLEIEVVRQLLDSVMAIKCDRMFQSIHGKCESIYRNLSAHSERPDCSSLFVMKHIESFLIDIYSREIIDSDIHEMVVTSAVDFMEGLRKDPSKAGIFKFYLGVEEDVFENDNDLYGGQRGNLLVFINALDRCYSEPVNLKVLNFFIDLLGGELCTGLKDEVRKKFLKMELSCLSNWLEKRLLGCTAETSGGPTPAKGSSSLREATVNFMLCLLSPSSEVQSRALQSHFIDALLMSLDSAFVLYDIHTAQAYFNFIVQLSNGGLSMKQLLERTVVLMEKLACDENLLQGLKFLFGFVGAILSACGASKNVLDKLSGKNWSNNSLGAGPVVFRSVGSRKNSETLVIPVNQESGSVSIDCDAMSVDEDEDDGTSDGELASMDKDDEDDSNGERALASKVCTFTSSGSNFMEQHWYFCYTCDLTVSKGCCSVCAKVCHRGHRVVYSRSSRFFCDCGAGGVRGSSCQCLKPRKFTGSTMPARGSGDFQSLLPFSEDGEQPPDSDSDLDDDFYLDFENSFKLSIPGEVQGLLPSLLKDLDIEGRVLELCNKLRPAVTARRDSNLSKDHKFLLGEDKVLSYNVDLLQLKKAYKSGFLDLKIKADYSNARELKSHLASGSLIKSLLSISIRGKLAAGEGDKVAIFDVGQLIGQPTVAPVTADKTNVKPLSKNVVVRFEIVHLLFNPVVESYLAVAGYEECQVLTVNPRGEVTDRLAIELALQGAYIRRVDWVPGSQVQLMVVTNKFVKIYDLSQDNISPMHYFTLPDDLIVDATLIVAPRGRMFLLVLSEHGCLYRLELSLEGDVGAKPLNEIIQVQGKDMQSKGLSLYFSSTYRVLFLSYQDGTSLIGRLDANATSLTEISYVYEDEQDGKRKPAGLHHWKELLAGNALFVCFSSLKSNAALTFSMGAHELYAQNVRNTVGSALPLVGITSYRPLSKDKTPHCLVLHDDGSLQIFSHIPVGVDAGANVSSDQAKKLGSGILNNRVYAGLNPEFPLDFFEKTICITADVKLSGDAIRNSDSEGTKQNLASDDGFLESPSPAGFKVTVSNSNPDIVMVGFRVHVGNTSASHIPSEITIFQRVVKLDEGMRSWYDIPFTVAESLLADEEFTITVGPTFNGSALPRIDSLEVYGRAKDEFGWKEKMDAVLDMEAHVLGSNSVISGVGKKCRAMQSAPIQEQVIAGGLKLLSRFYSLCRSKTCIEVEEVNNELSKLKCKKVLETIFESDREPLLQSAACHVLQAVFPKRETYYLVKDTMRLLGVVNSSPILASRLGVGGATAGWVIREFTAQMRAVSKIALHRRSNMAMFLETHGSGLVDGLMQVLWGILDLEQPDTQTINNIVIPSVELIYSYAECLALHGSDASGHSVAPAVVLLKKLLFAPYDAVQTSSSLAISSRLLQVPFPKQTMLTTDDVMENTVSAPMPSDMTSAAGGNTQVMIEEDSTASSVQYCCDGCSTVPILRRRWHCNVCPDFDLCEACYEVMDADRLPPPHSRDHPMSAIAIEVDTIGGDGNEIQFSMEDLSDSGLQVPADISLHNSPPSIHLLEHNESGDFPASVIDHQRIVSISASKRAVNSLLLRELIGELKGWMESTSGVRAIPVMQLFYRLSSAVGGPFMDSSKPENLDLEKFVKWFLDEINLNKPLAAKSHSPFGEVVILVFMFFILMLRNWHQPGSDNSLPKSSVTADVQDKSSMQVPSSASTTSSSIDDQEKNEFASQLLRACTVLRQQPFVNYLMDVLQQLVHLFKSPPTNFESGHGLTPGSGCGALLTVRRELPAGNFSPFFSDSYAKSHRTDIFMDYHRLLLENTFRLVYSLIRPEKHDKSVEKEKVYKTSVGKDLKLDGYQDVLCSYINNPHTTFVRRYARRLFLHLCGSKTHYYNVRDSWQLSNEVKKLYKLVNKSGGFQNPVPYERSVKLVKCLSAISEVAGARPRNWQKYCSKHGDVLQFLMNSIFYFGEESVIHTLKLLNLAFYTGKDMGHAIQKAEAGDAGTSSNKAGAQSTDTKKKKRSDDGGETSSEKSYLDMEQAVEIFSEKNGSVVRQLIDSFLLEWNSSTVRLEAKCVLYGIWHHGKQSFKETMLVALLEKVKCLPMYGQNIVEYTELLTWLLGKVPSSKQHDTELVGRCLTPDVVKFIFETLHSQNELLANHPNSRIYNTLSGLVEFDGYYLESEPCVACSCPEVPYSRMKLETLKSETKFTDNRIIVKCTGSYTIQTVTMNVHDARKSKSVKVLNLYYNNRPVADLSELKNNWSLWKRAKSCHLAFDQTELKVEFPIPITACNFMIELDSFYENLQASSLESLQCPRCSRPVTDKHGICNNCHENAYQCRQCRNINYENLDSFLCNECGYSKYGRFEFNFMAKPSYIFDNMENDEDMKKGLAAIESESENAHRRYQQLLGFKKPLLKLVSSIGENEIDSQQKDSVQQMMVSVPGPSCKINRKIALLGVLYGEKCKAAFDSVSKSVQTLQGLRRVLMSYLHQKNSDNAVATSRIAVPRSPNNCYGCATTFVAQCLELLQVLSKHPNCKKQLVASGILSELFENNIHQGPKTARIQARAVLCALSEGDANAVAELNNLIQKKVMYCLEHHRSMDIAVATREELLLLSETCSVADEFWEARLRVAFQLLFSSIKLGAKHPSISEHVILPCLRIISQACTPPKPDTMDKEQVIGKPASKSQTKDESSANPSLNGLGNASKSSELSEKHWDSSWKSQDIQLLSYSEWEKGASYLDFVRRQYKASQAVKSTPHRSRRDPQRLDYLALKYALRWKRLACKRSAKSAFSAFELGSWVSELVLSACSQSIRSEMCTLISLLCAQNSSRRSRLLNLLMELLPATLSVGESAAEYFELLFKMIDLEDSRLFLTAKGCLTTICRLITQEVGNVESKERSLHIDISQGFILHKLIELLSKFLEVPNIRSRFIKDDLLSEVLEALLVIRGLIVQKTKLIGDCNKLLKDLLDSLLLESSENKRHFIRACISGLQNHGEERKGRTSLFILEQLCNMICPSKPEPVYLLILNKAHTQEEFIRGSMTKNPYSSTEIGLLMRDVKNKICHQLDLLGLLEDDFGMELLVAGNIISLDLSISQVYEQVWKKSHSQTANTVASSPLLSSCGFTPARDCPPMTVTYRLQGLDGEATEPMIKELEEEREESQDPEVEFAIAGAVQECGGLEIILGMIQHLRDDELKSNQEELSSVLNLLMYCCKIRENRRALLRLGALGLLLETARRAFSVDAMEPAEGILLIVESLTMEANESDIGITQSVLTVTNEETGAGEQAKKIVLMFLERLCHPSGLKKSNKQQRNNEMVARILPYLTYGEPAAMEALIQHFNPYLQDWCEFDRLQTQHLDNPKDETLAQQAAKQQSSLENFVRVSESLKTSSCGDRLKDIILEKGITGVAVKHLSESFRFVGQAGFKSRSSAEWALGLKLPSVPLILSMLRGLSRGHLPTQRCIDEGGILPLLHALEGVPGENEIGARAENLLDTLSDKEGKGDGFLGEKVHKLRHATRDEMRRLALRKREKLLRGLGMRQEVASDGGERIIVSQPIIEGLEDMEEEEDGIACMVCREGYSLRPNDMLGVYSYSKRVNLGMGTSGSGRGEWFYTTVSHFNIIHFQCHQEAKRADAALKNPKKEWEGATLRNNKTLCNCIFPLRGPAVPIAQYVRCVDQYWDNLNALGRADGSRLRLLTYDIVLMLARFSTDCKGAGRESNSRFLPFMIQMACHLLDQGSSNQRRAMAKAVSSYLTSTSRTESKPSAPSSTRHSFGTDETVQFMMVSSLLSDSYEDWLQHRRAFLQRGIYHAYMQRTHGGSTHRLSSDPTTVVRSEGECGSENPASETGGNLFSIIQPMLIYTGLIEQLQRFFKMNKSANKTTKKAEGTSGEADGDDGNNSMEGWEVVMKEKLVNMKEMVGFSKEMLSWLEDMTSASDLQEAFDVIGALGDVLSGGFTRCEEFVQAAIAAGRS